MTTKKREGKSAFRIRCSIHCPNRQSSRRTTADTRPRKSTRSVMQPVLDVAPFPSFCFVLRFVWTGVIHLYPPVSGSDHDERNSSSNVSRRRIVEGDGRRDIYTSRRERRRTRGGRSNSSRKKKNVLSRDEVRTRGYGKFSRRVVASFRTTERRSDGRVS